MFGKIFSGAMAVAVLASVQAIPAPLPFPAGRNSTTNGNPGRTITNGNITVTAQRNGADNACARGFTQFCGLYTPTNGTLATNGTNTTTPANTTTPTNGTVVAPGRRSFLLPVFDGGEFDGDESDGDESDGDDFEDNESDYVLPLVTDQLDHIPDAGALLSKIQLDTGFGEDSNVDLGGSLGEVGVGAGQDGVNVHAGGDVAGIDVGLGQDAVVVGADPSPLLSGTNGESAPAQ